MKLETRFNKRFKQLVEDEILSRTRFLADGRALCFEDYKHLVGFLQGLTYCLDVADDIENDITGKKEVKGQP